MPDTHAQSIYAGHKNLLLLLLLLLLPPPPLLLRRRRRRWRPRLTTIVAAQSHGTPLQSHSDNPPC